jgi:hypothetical protein
LVDIFLVLQIPINILPLIESWLVAVSNTPEENYQTVNGKHEQKI